MEDDTKSDYGLKRYKNAKYDYLRLTGRAKQVQKNDLIPDNDVLVNIPVIALNQGIPDWRKIYIADQIVRNGVVWKWTVPTVQTQGAIPLYYAVNSNYQNNQNSIFQSVTTPFGSSSNIMQNTGLNPLSNPVPVSSTRLVYSPPTLNSPGVMLSVESAALPPEYEDLPDWKKTYRGNTIFIGNDKYYWQPLEDMGYPGNSGKGIYLYYN